MTEEARFLLELSHGNQAAINAFARDAVTAQQIKLVAKLLRNVPFFQERQIDAEAELVEIASSLMLEECQAGEMVFEEGEPGYKFYIILKGAVAVSKRIAEPLSEEQIRRQLRVAQEHGDAAADLRQEIDEHSKELLSFFRTLSAE